MKLWITIDELDGSTVVRGPFNPDQIDTWGLLMRLSHSGIAGVTFTNAEPLKHLLKQGAANETNKGR